MTMEKMQYQYNKLDENSVKGLSKGITSSTLLVISFILGTRLAVLYGPSLIGYVSTNYSFVFDIIIMMLIVLNLNIAGMIIGISGIGHSNLIKKPIAIKTTGKVTSIVGTILNSIALTILIFILLSPFYNLLV
ncbi:MAG: hypothetical protein JW891_08920 [Candidatus Lokiarchaeota archaeon]|nr:hypothetical protein [Candidatus Lokiarchaeota archaeon]